MRQTTTTRVTDTIAQLYESYARNILMTIRRYTSSDADAEDALLEVFLAALENQQFLTLDENRQLAWLHRVAQRKAIDIHRRRTRHPAISLEGEDDAPVNWLTDDDDQTPERTALRQEEYHQLRAHIERLPKQQQQVIHLRFGAGMRCVDIARELQQRESTVRTWLSRSLQTLRSIYENHTEKEG